MEVSVQRSAQNFLGSLSLRRKLASFENSSGVDSKYPIDPVQPLGHLGSRVS